MKIDRTGYPLVVLSHRKQEFLPRALVSLRRNISGVTDVIVVDDSGDPEHHQWLDAHGLQFSVVDPSGNAGYLAAMNLVWGTALAAADRAGVDYAMLWEEDFLLTRSVDTRSMSTVLQKSPNLANLNLQRQAVYPIERRFGYMESHARRGYRLTPRRTGDTAWVRRERPFTTNPGLISAAVLDDTGWPTRAECAGVEGGAEPAMSERLESQGYYFGWLGSWDQPQTRHIGLRRKTGTGY